MKNMGFDITGSYAIDVAEDSVVKGLLEEKGGEQIREQVLATGTMSIEQILTLQLLQHRFSSE